jgi:hypothetical protein
MEKQKNTSKLQPGTEIKIAAVQEVLPKEGRAHSLITTEPWGRDPSGEDMAVPSSLGSLRELAPFF